MKNDLFSSVYDKGGKLMETKNAKNGGYLVGRSHKEGGIKGVNVDTGDPIEVEGGEVVITKPAVDSNKYYTLNGKKMKPKDILSKLNSDHGGVAFAEGGKVGSRKYLLGGMTNDEKKDFIEARYAGKSIIIAQNDDLSSTVYVFNSWDEAYGGIIDIKYNKTNIYCVSNIPSAVPHRASNELSNAIYPYIENIIKDMDIQKTIENNDELRRGINIYKGEIWNINLIK